MKNLSKLALCLLLAMSLTVSAFAAQIPDSLVVENLNGQQRLVKTYTLSPEVDPDELKEEDFSYDGYPQMDCHSFPVSYLLQLLYTALPYR